MLTALSPWSSSRLWWGWRGLRSSLPAVQGITSPLWIHYGAGSLCLVALAGDESLRRPLKIDANLYLWSQLISPLIRPPIEPLQPCFDYGVRPVSTWLCELGLWKSEATSRECEMDPNGPQAKPTSQGIQGISALEDDFVIVFTYSHPVDTSL